MEIRKVAVIGAGTMGNGICHVFAQYGFEVALIDVSQSFLEKAKSTIEKNLERQVNKDIINPAVKSQALANISPSYRNGYRGCPRRSGDRSRYREAGSQTGPIHQVRPAL